MDHAEKLKQTLDEVGKHIYEYHRKSIEPIVVLSVQQIENYKKLGLFISKEG